MLFALACALSGVDGWSSAPSARDDGPVAPASCPEVQQHFQRRCALGAAAGDADGAPAANMWMQKAHARAGALPPPPPPPLWLHAPKTGSSFCSVLRHALCPRAFDGIQRYSHVNSGGAAYSRFVVLWRLALSRAMPRGPFFLRDCKQNGWKPRARTSLSVSWPTTTPPPLRRLRRAPVVCHAGVRGAPRGGRRRGALELAASTAVRRRAAPHAQARAVRHGRGTRLRRDAAARAARARRFGVPGRAPRRRAERHRARGAPAARARARVRAHRGWGGGWLAAERRATLFRRPPLPRGRRAARDPLSPSVAAAWLPSGARPTFAVRRCRVASRRRGRGPFFPRASDRCSDGRECRAVRQVSALAGSRDSHQCLSHRATRQAHHLSPILVSLRVRSWMRVGAGMGGRGGAGTSLDTAPRCIWRVVTDVVLRDARRVASLVRE